MRQSKALIGLHGYSLHGTFEHRLSKESSFAITYSHYHYDFPRAFGESTVESFQAGYSTSFDRRRWTIKVLAGAMQTEVEGLQVVTLDPIVAGILGVPTTVQAYYQKSLIPAGQASLSRKFKSASLNFNYQRGVTPGNGVYLTSRQESGGASFTYTGVRRVSLNVGGSYDGVTSLGQGLTPYHSFNASAGASYSLVHALQLRARYDSRHQEIDVTTFKKDSYRISFGIAFSPGDIPLAIW